MDFNATKKYLVTLLHILKFCRKEYIDRNKEWSIGLGPPANVLRFGCLDFFLNRVNLVQAFILLMWPVIKNNFCYI